MLAVRYETPEDVRAIHYVNEQAFAQGNEADLVDALRRTSRLILSLVATEDHQVVGHAAFSPVAVEGPNAGFTAVGLGPMAVLPGHQRRGVGSRLVEAGLAEIASKGHEAVFVVGHPEFYPRFGFSPAGRYGFRCEYDVPDEVFMFKELREGALRGRTGIVKYSPQFNYA